MCNFALRFFRRSSLSFKPFTMRRLPRVFVWVVGFLVCGIAASGQTPEDLKRLVDNQNFDETRNAVRVMLAESDKRPEPFYYLGLSYLEEALLQEEPALRKDLLEKSKQPFLDGIERKKKYANNYLGLGRYYAYTGKITEAKVQFQVAYDAASDDPSTLVDIAQAYITTGDQELLEKATELLARAETFDASNPRIYESLGDVWFERGIEELPLFNYQKALQLNSKLVTVHHKIGKYYMLYKKYSEAVNSLKEAQALDPSYAPVYPDLGELYYLAQRFETATEYYRKYVELRGQDQNARYRYAQFLYLSSQYETALTELTAVDTVTRVKLRLVAYCAYELKKYDLAKTNIDELFAKSDPSLLLAKDFEYRGKIRLQTGDETGGVEDVLKAVSMDATRLDLYTYLRDYFNKKRDFASGLRFQKLATEADPSAKSYYELGQQAYYAKTYEVAVEGYQKVIDIKPEFLPAYLGMARTQGALDPETTQGLAKPFYEKVVELGEKDRVANKKALAEAYLFMGVFEVNVNQNYKGSIEWTTKLLAIDPEHEQGKKLFNQINDYLKQVDDSKR